MTVLLEFTSLLYYNENKISVAGATWRRQEQELSLIHIFIVNVVLNEDKKIIASFAGDTEDAHLQGCNFVTDLAHVSKVPCDSAISTNGG